MQAEIKASPQVSPARWRVCGPQRQGNIRFMSNLIHYVQAGPGGQVIRNLYRQSV